MQHKIKDYRLPSGSSIAYRYTPSNWDENKFQAHGGFAAVVLNYNKKGMIVKALMSAYAQDYPCYEIWCMDDASSDGSFEEMLACAKAYKGEQRLTVVRHTVNQMITGQWNCVARLSDAQWFGMFCGDDEALPNRISDVSEIIREHPTIKGCATNFLYFNERENRITLNVRDSWVWHGVDLVIGYRFHVLGCAAFWHKDMFRYILPKCNIDDWFLTCAAYILWQDSADEILILDATRTTVRYSIGTGITSEALKGALRKGWLARHKACYLNHKKVNKQLAIAWNGILTYDCEHGRASAMREVLKGLWLVNQMENESRINRLILFVRFYTTLRNNTYGGTLSYVRKQLNIAFVSNFLGLISYLLVEGGFSLSNRLKRAFKK